MAADEAMKVCKFDVWRILLYFSLNISLLYAKQNCQMSNGEREHMMVCWLYKFNFLLSGSGLEFRPYKFSSWTVQPNWTNWTCWNNPKVVIYIGTRICTWRLKPYENTTDQNKIKLIALQIARAWFLGTRLYLSLHHIMYYFHINNAKENTWTNTDLWTYLLKKKITP